jgi:hypothetical protein
MAFTLLGPVVLLGLFTQLPVPLPLPLALAGTKRQQQRATTVIH